MTRGPASTGRLELVSLEEFVAVDEPGAVALVGQGESVLIPQGGDVMVYGDGGAGKTTLTIDLACHLAAGQQWVGIPVLAPARVLLIENEGPRALLRRKLNRKVRAWKGSPLQGRISVVGEPWGEFTFADRDWRDELVAAVGEYQIDVLIAGPLTRLGMDAAGTLQEVAAFMGHVAEVRRRSGRPLTVILVHHENKGGTVSGAWEGAGDTLLHVQAAGNGHTVLNVQKARWASEYHGKTLRLAWADGEGFTVGSDSDRDIAAEIEELLASDGLWRTVREIAGKKDDPKLPGISAGEKVIKEALNGNRARFEMRTGDEAVDLERVSSSKLWGLRSGPNAHDADDADGAFLGGAEEGSASASTLKGRRPFDAPPAGEVESAPAARRTGGGGDLRRASLDVVRCVCVEPIGVLGEICTRCESMVA